MRIQLPLDLRAETFVNYLPENYGEVELKGMHKRTAYEDILSVDYDGNRMVIEICRNGLYDILPEALFHPIDRFNNIPANNYKELFKQECELQSMEESDARKFFSVFDKFLFDLDCEFNRIKDEYYGGNSFIASIICDDLPESVLNNRFVKKLVTYIPSCGRIRGNKDMITLILRKILNDEGITFNIKNNTLLHTDNSPRYAVSIDDNGNDIDNFYVGNQYYETVTEYEILYWDENECNDSFLSFVSEIKVLEEFMNDYFIGIENSLKFIVETVSSPVRLSDDLYFNYLDYNTNL